MEDATKHDAIERCESILRQRKADNINQKICPGECDLIDRLLARQLELAPVYQEACEKLNTYQLSSLFDALLVTARYWDPESNQTAREERHKLIEVNKGIARKARELSKLLEQRSVISNTSSFTSDTHYHICDVIDEASIKNGRYQSYVREPLSLISSRFDLDYWPSLAEIITVIGADADRAETIANNPLTAITTESLRNSKTDYVKAILFAIDDRASRCVGQLPADFKLSDSSLATVVNVMQDLEHEDFVDATYIKGIRQRFRKKGSA